MVRLVRKNENKEKDKHCIFSCLIGKKSEKKNLTYKDKNLKFPFL